MRQFLVDVLKGLEAAVPPPSNAHHSITYARYGSDESGWEDRLALHVNRDGKFTCLFLDDGDFQADSEPLVKAIVWHLENPK